MKRSEYIPALDGIRAIAILLVIPHNANIYSMHPGLFWPLAVAAHAGWIGVQLFFVLSGFLITGNLLDSRESDNYYRTFYVRRLLRIAPLYYFTLLAGLVIIPALISEPAEVLGTQKHQLWLWLFLSNWTQPFNMGVTGFSHFWSLAVEEQFYLLWPLVVTRWQSKRLVLVCLGLTAAALLSRVLLVGVGAPPFATYMFTICRMDALALGAAAAVLARNVSAVSWFRQHDRLLLAVSGIAMIVGALLTRVYTTDQLGTQLLGYPLLALIFASVILIASTDNTGQPPSPLNRLLSLAPLRSVGKYSYAMYVLHLPLAIVLAEPLKPALARFESATAPLFALIIVVLSYIAGLLSYHLLEKHFLRLKPHLAPIH